MPFLFPGTQAPAWVPAPVRSAYHYGTFDHHCQAEPGEVRYQAEPGNEEGRGDALPVSWYPGSRLGTHSGTLCVPLRHFQPPLPGGAWRSALPGRAW
jgi:hypothetical protein